MDASEDINFDTHPGEMTRDINENSLELESGETLDRDSKSKDNDRSSMTSVHDTRRQPVHECSNKRRKCSSSQSNNCQQEDECSKFESSTVKQARKFWDIELKAKVLRHFSAFIDVHKVPRKFDCMRCKKIFKISSHTWKDIKNLIYNKIKDNKRK